jgi:LytS/YehU family sensor histidine kinase
MNPHFLFNVLNSIKGYIYENDKGNAAKYLSEFSNLVRKVLELSSVPTVPLDEELEALNLYINLEAMLLQNDFEYKLNIEDGIDQGFIYPHCCCSPMLRTPSNTVFATRLAKRYSRSVSEWIMKNNY